MKMGRKEGARGGGGERPRGPVQELHRPPYLVKGVTNHNCEKSRKDGENPTAGGEDGRMVA